MSAAEAKVFPAFLLTSEKFMEHLVTYQDFAKNPGIIEDPSLVICINSKYDSKKYIIMYF